MIPYERNAWDNDKSVPAISESIRQFGFRGQIKLWRHDDPVIVSGHHRVKACEMLGWDEIPDECICWCEDMTEEDVKAFRLADNKTGQGGKWNKGLMKSEVRALSAKGVDMSRFNFDFKSKNLPYGAERMKTDDRYNLQLVNAFDCGGDYDMPLLDPVMHVPDSLMPFNYCMSADNFDSGVHFFIDDYQFERLWSQPERYIDLLAKFDCVLTPDFSLYMDMPLPMQQFNEYRRRALGNLWQRNGLTVIPTISWSDERSYGFCFDGIPKHATIATSTVGVKRDEDARRVWSDGMREALSKLEPSCVLLYGGNIGFDFGRTEVKDFGANTAFR